MTRKGPWGFYYGNNCPPDDACDDNLSPVFRLVPNTHITTNDFKPRMRPTSKRLGISKCDALGTSLWDDRQTVKDAKKLAPVRRHRPFIAEGYIKNGDGPYKINQSDGHITWWVIIMNPEKSFKV